MIAQLMIASNRYQRQLDDLCNTVAALLLTNVIQFRSKRLLLHDEALTEGGVAMAASLADSRYEKDEWLSTYGKIIRAKPGPEVRFEPAKTALFIVDVQKGFCFPECDPDLPVMKEIAPEDYRYFVERQKIVVSNLQKLQSFFRENGLEVVQCVAASVTLDGRDRRKGSGVNIAPGSKEAEVLDELTPKPDEVLLTKTRASMFTGYNTYFMLENMGIEYLVFGGLLTDQCVQATVTSALDLLGGQRIAVVEDCCIAYSERDHVGAIRHMGTSATIASTASVINHLTDLL
jgi:nicotinamidase-related amidase